MIILPAIPLLLFNMMPANRKRNRNKQVMCGECGHVMRSDHYTRHTRVHGSIDQSKDLNGMMRNDKHNQHIRPHRKHDLFEEVSAKRLRKIDYNFKAGRDDLNESGKQREQAVEGRKHDDICNPREADIYTSAPESGAEQDRNI